MKFINTYSKLGKDFFSKTEIEAFENPILIDYNTELAEELGLNLNENEVKEYFSGQKLFSGSEIISSVYAGHQFGSFVPQLGDGRAHLLGEIDAKNHSSYEIQLKGSGKTPYSRFGDGKAVLRSSIREYLASEALHYLGIPTTRALCLIGSDENVMREGVEKAAMVTRVSPSFVRFGHFEFFTHNKQPENTRILADYIIEKFYPDALSFQNKYEKFFYLVMNKTAKLMAKWQAFGFTHGVMNTDNMSILGISIDYGPYGFVDGFDYGYVPNHSDHTGRYSYMNQPQIAHWNLFALSYGLEPVLPLNLAKEILSLYSDIFSREYIDIMRQKLGLKQKKPEDLQLIQGLMQLLNDFEVDYTIFFRHLCELKINEINSNLHKMFKKPEYFIEWEEKYKKRIMLENWADYNKNPSKLEKERELEMKKINPKFILRNYLAETAIRQATYAEDYSEVKKLRQILKKPFDEQAEFEVYAAPPPDWSKDICISCSS
ncbi:MAG: YdiU family protein [Rickettsiales bacterium]|nr:YdiU family protein [Rickettsiales bacterium]